MNTQIKLVDYMWNFKDRYFSITELSNKSGLTPLQVRNAVRELRRKGLVVSRVNTNSGRPTYEKQYKLSSSKSAVRRINYYINAIAESRSEQSNSAYLRD